MAVHHIRSMEDPRLADYVHMRDRDLRRHEEGLFVGEQLLVVERMLAIPGLTRSVLASEAAAERVAPLVPREVPLYAAPQELLREVAGFNVHRGVLAIGRRDRLAGVDLTGLAGDPAAPRTLLLCEDITHLDNIGLLFRNAAAFAVDGVLLSPRCHDPLYRKSLRVSIGHALTVPWMRSSDWAGDLERLATLGVAIYGASLDPSAVPLDDVERPHRVALLVGTEFAGLSAEARKRCRALVRVPMAPGVDSLNVAVAAAVCLHRMSRGVRR